MKGKRFIPFLLLTLFSFSQQTKMISTTSTKIPFNFSEPKNLTSLTALTLYATQYYIYKANDGGTIPLLDINEKPLGYSLDTCDWCSAAIEGTLYLKDKKGNTVVLNFAGRSKEPQVNCTRCERLKNYTNQAIGKALWAVSANYGDGVSGYKLIPYRTIAVDPAKIALGSVLYIPSAKGKMITLPDGSTAQHDGYFFAGDKGSDINQNHIDIFTGLSKTNPFPEIVTSNSNKIFTAYIVKDTAIISNLTSFHKNFK